VWKTIGTPWSPATGAKLLRNVDVGYDGDDAEGELEMPVAARVPTVAI
jgi:hypothetical protein